MKYIAVLHFLFFGLSLSAQPYPDSRTGGKYFEVNGAKLWVVSFGQGDPLFIIPGGPGGSHYQYRVFDSLAQT
ncbi:MAG TPA: hypothetical protein VKR32_14525, partial [Puia sp.]|nr:hypothetical protein [Puia sp.]